MTDQILQISDLEVETPDARRIDALGQKIVLSSGEEKAVEIHVEKLGIKIKFWVRSVLP